MKVLILGYSDIVNRKILPAINLTKDITKIEIASRSIKNLENAKPVSKIYSTYNEAIEKSDAEIVYISLPNNLHFEYCMSALNSKKNVIVDKPAILNLGETNKIYQVAVENNVFVSMSCVFNYHNCWKKFNSLTNNLKNNGVLYLDFTIPKLKSDNIRMSNELAGGAFNDMAIYASMAGLLFWNRSAEKIKIEKLDKKSLNITFKVSTNYGDRKEMVGNFSFDKPYKNEIKFKNNNSIYQYNRVFSPPQDYETKIQISKNNKSEYIDVGKDNTFKNYLDHVTMNFKNKNILRDEFLRYNLEYEKFLNSYE